MKNLLLLCFLSISTAALADGDAAAGKAKSGTCAACHGVNGISSIPGYPHLAGQDYTYLLAQLKAFKSGERTGGNAALMAPMATGLSEQDMKDLAAYYNQL
ncbi:MAG: cytochrome c [Pseudomonadota bacterium]